MNTAAVSGMNKIMKYPDEIYCDIPIINSFYLTGTVTGQDTSIR